MSVEWRANQDLNFLFFPLPLLWLLFDKVTLLTAISAFKGIRIPESKEFLLWNPDSRKLFCSWNPESWPLESGIHHTESGILLTFGIRKPSSTDKESVIQCLESGIHGVESRIPDYIGCPYMHGATAILIGNGKPGLQRNLHITKSSV